MKKTVTRILTNVNSEEKRRLVVDVYEDVNNESYLFWRNNMNEIIPGRYRHFKGNEYEVLYIAKHSETLEPMVVYRALYGERGIWVRPAFMWNETVTRDGKTYKRFTYIGE